jgi:hypothetical protein
VSVSVDRLRVCLIHKEQQPRWCSALSEMEAIWSEDLLPRDVHGQILSYLDWIDHTLAARVAMWWALTARLPHSWPVEAACREGHGYGDELIQTIASKTRVTDLLLVGEAPSHVVESESGEAAAPLAIFTDAALEAAGRLHLRVLSTQRLTHITDAGVERLTRAPAHATLRAVSMFGRGCSLTVQSCEPLSTLPALESLHLNVAITDTGLQQLARLPRLRRLVFNRCVSVTDTGLAHLAQGACRHTLQCLRLPSVSNITDAGLQSLGSLSTLTDLLLTNSPHITDQGLAQLLLSQPADARPHLRRLSLGSCRALRGDAFHHLGHDMTDLTLSLKRLKRLDWLATLPALQRLRLEGCSVLDAHTWATGLAGIVGPVSWLTLVYCRKIDTRALRAIGDHQGLRNTLQALEFEGCARVADDGVALLVPLAASLTSLHLGSCGVTDAALASIGKLSHVTELDLSHCAIKDHELHHLQSLPLRWLELSHTKVSDQGCRRCLLPMKTLKHFSAFGTDVSNSLLNDFFVGGVRSCV